MIERHWIRQADGWLFVDAATGDYRVKASSPALTLGFESFPMDKSGTQKREFQPVIKEVTAIE